MARVAGLAAKTAALRRKPNAQKRVAFILTNSPGKAARIGNAVGLDAPASLIRFFAAMREAGYRVDDVPADGDALIHALIDRCSYDETILTSRATGQRRRAGCRWSSTPRWFDELPETLKRGMAEQWGPPPGEAYVHDGAIALAGLELGNVFLALQPPRGYGMDPNAIYHQPDLPPPHNYYALYRWLRDVWGADAVVHFGKHGTLEWLPGKGVGLSRGLLPRRVPRRPAAVLPVHPQRPRRGGPGQAPRPRRHRRSSVAADDHGRRLRRARPTRCSWWTSIIRSKCSTRPRCRCCSSRSGT